MIWIPEGMEKGKTTEELARDHQKGIEVLGDVVGQEEAERLGYG